MENTKICIECNIEKELNRFSLIKGRGENKHSNKCTECLTSPLDSEYDISCYITHHTARNKDIIKHIKKLKKLRGIDEYHTKLLKDIIDEWEGVIARTEKEIRILLINKLTKLRNE